DVGVDRAEPLGRPAPVDRPGRRNTHRVRVGRVERQDPAHGRHAPTALAPDAGHPFGARPRTGFPKGVESLLGVARDLEALHRSGAGGGVPHLLRTGGAAGGELDQRDRDEQAGSGLDHAPSNPGASPEFPGRSQLVAGAPGAGATATPQGAFPTGIRPITLSVSVSTAVTSFDGPLAL